MKTFSFTLPNKLQTILVDTEAFPSATTLLLVGAGSRYENKKNNGIAHFFEHMAFKGSKKYPNTQIIASTIEGLGGICNAFTGKDHTGYWIKAPTQHFEKTLSILADMVINPLLKPSEIEREKGVVIEEINMYEDAPQKQIFDIYEKILFPNHPLGMSITGTKKTVMSFTRKTFTSYMKSLYRPENSLLVIAGGLKNGYKKTYKSYKEAVNKYFHLWKNDKTISFVPFKSTQKKPVLFIKEKKTEQVHFCLGFRSFSFFDKRKYSLSVLASLLGQGMSSRLFMEVREKRGLCYYIHTYNDDYHDTGTIVTHAGVKSRPSHVREAINVILKEHSKIAKGDITSKELKKVKENLKGNFLLSLEDTFDVAAFFGRTLLMLKTMQTPQEILEKIDAVTADQVVDLARELFVPKNLNIALIGPVSDKDISEFENWDI